MRRVRRFIPVIWSATLFLAIIALAAAARRMYVLLNPAQAAPRFAGARLDPGFAQHQALTFFHILPASLLMVLLPLQFVPRLRANHTAWHRWSGRLVLLLGAIVGVSALIMSYSMAIGGANETAATTLYAVLFLLCLGLGFWNARQRRIAEHREWMIRAYGIALGIATTRPIVAAFFVAGKLTPHEFFGTAFWLGFTLTLIGAETWIQYSRSQFVDLAAARR